MRANSEDGTGRSGSRWRIAAWSVAALVLLLPLVAMQLTGEVNWTGSDFIFAATLIGGVGVIFELAVRTTADHAYRGAVGVALAAAFLLVWINAAVGIIGSEDNPANLMFGGVLAVGIVGAILARFRPDGMARALSATALAQASVGVIALAAGLGSTAPSFPEAIVFLTGFFAVLWLLSAYLFRKTAREQARAGAGPGSTR